MKTVRTTIWLTVLLLTGCHEIDLTPGTRDEGPIAMGGSDPVVHFLISHNVDDDNNDTVIDKTENILNPNENNLRELKFNKI